LNTLSRTSRSFSKVHLVQITINLDNFLLKLRNGPEIVLMRIHALEAMVVKNGMTETIVGVIGINMMIGGDLLIFLLSPSLVLLEITIEMDIAGILVMLVLPCVVDILQNHMLVTNPLMTAILDDTNEPLLSLSLLKQRYQKTHVAHCES
jgi:hypothetical protein